jgi:hypothetical protein
MKKSEKLGTIPSGLVTAFAIAKIVSGGQTGVDRAALDVALELDIPCSGWCPKGRRAENGPIPERYPLEETPLPFYPQRTEWNIRDSDGTLVLTMGKPDGGTALTIALARRFKKPCLVIDLKKSPEFNAVRNWIQTNQLQILNVAGPREKDILRIYPKARRFLHRLLCPSNARTKKKETLP